MFELSCASITVSNINSAGSSNVKGNAPSGPASVDTAIIACRDIIFSI